MNWRFLSGLIFWKLLMELEFCIWSRIGWQTTAFFVWIDEFYIDFQIDWMNSRKLQLLYSSLDMICGLKKLYGQTIKGFNCHEHFVVSSPSYHISTVPINQPLEYQSFDRKSQVAYASWGTKSHALKRWGGFDWWILHGNLSGGLHCTNFESSGKLYTSVLYNSTYIWVYIYIICIIYVVFSCFLIHIDHQCLTCFEPEHFAPSDLNGESTSGWMVGFGCISWGAKPGVGVKRSWNLWNSGLLEGFFTCSFFDIMASKAIF